MMLEKIMAWLMVLLAASMSVNASIITLSQDDSRSIFGDEKVISIGEKDYSSIGDFFDYVDAAISSDLGYKAINYDKATDKLKSIKASNPDAFVGLKTKYPQLIDAFDQDNANRLDAYSGFYLKYSENKKKSQDEQAKASQALVKFNDLETQLASDGIISVDSEGVYAVIKELSRDEKLKLIGLQNAEYDSTAHLLLASKYARLAFGNSETADIDEELDRTYYDMNNNEIRREFLEASDFLDFSIGNENSNLILYASLRNANGIYKENSARLAPLTWGAGADSVAYLKQKGLPEQLFTGLTFTINTFNPIYLIGDLSKNPELWNHFFYKWSETSVIKAKKLIDSGKAKDIPGAISLIKQESAQKKALRDAETKAALEGNKDLEVLLNENVIVPEGYAGKITLNGGQADVSKLKGISSIGIGELGGNIVELSPLNDDTRVRRVYGSLFGNDITSLQVADGRVVITDKQLDSIQRNKEEYNKDFIDNYFFSDKNPDLDDWAVYYLEHDTFIQAGIKLSDPSLSDSEKDKIRLEQAVKIREEGHSNVAAAIAAGIPEDTAVEYNGQSYTAKSLYDDIQGRINLLVFRPDSDEFRNYQAPDIVVSLVNPASWVTYGAIGKGGAALLGRFSVGRAYYGFTSSLGARVSGKIGKGFFRQAGLEVFKATGQLYAQEASAQIWPPSQFFMVVLGSGPGKTVSIRNDFKSAVISYADNSVTGVSRYSDKLDISSFSKDVRVRSIGNEIFEVKSGDRMTILAPEGSDLSKVKLKDFRIIAEPDIRLYLKSRGNKADISSETAFLLLADSARNTPFLSEKASLVSKYNGKVLASNDEIAILKQMDSESKIKVGDEWLGSDELKAKGWDDAKIFAEKEATRLYIDSRLYPSGRVYLTADGNVFRLTGKRFKVDSKKGDSQAIGSRYLKLVQFEDGSFWIAKPVWTPETSAMGTLYDQVARERLSHRIFEEFGVYSPDAKKAILESGEELYLSEYVPNSRSISKTEGGALTDPLVQAVNVWLRNDDPQLLEAGGKFIPYDSEKSLSTFFEPEQPYIVPYNYFEGRSKAEYADAIRKIRELASDEPRMERIVEDSQFESAFKEDILAYLKENADSIDDDIGRLVNYPGILEHTDVELERKGFGVYDAEDGQVAVPLSEESALKAPEEFGCLVLPSPNLIEGKLVQGCRYNFRVGDFVAVPGNRKGPIAYMTYEPSIRFSEGGIVPFGEAQYYDGKKWIPMVNLNPNFVSPGGLAYFNGKTWKIGEVYGNGYATVNFGSRNEPYPLGALYAVNSNKRIDVKHLKGRDWDHSASLDWHYDSRTINELSKKIRDKYGADRVSLIEGIAVEVKNALPYRSELADTADKAESISQIIECGGGVCRHNAPITTGVAQKLGFDAKEVGFWFRDEYKQRHGHAITVIELSGKGFNSNEGDFWVVDASLGHAVKADVYFLGYGKIYNRDIYIMEYWSESKGKWAEWPVGKNRYFR